MQNSRPHFVFVVRAEGFTTSMVGFVVGAGRFATSLLGFVVGAGGFAAPMLVLMRLPSLIEPHFYSLILLLENSNLHPTGTGA